MTAEQRLTLLEMEIARLKQENEEREKILNANPTDWQTEARWLGMTVKVKEVSRRELEL